MATVDLGKISFTQKGTWNSGTAYVAKDVVQYVDDNETSSYVAVASSTNQTPSTNGTVNTSYWVLFAKGATVGSTNQGVWDVATAYQKNAVVQYTDTGVVSTYLAVADSTGETPSTAGTVNSTYWQLIAKGTDSVGLSWQSTIVTGTTLSAVAGNGYWIDTTSNACTITLPASASVGDQIIFSDYKRTWGTNKITLNTNGLNFQGNQTAGGGGYPEYNTDGQSVTIIYSGATQGWIPTVDDDVTYETPQTYTVDFLVIAGGGGGGKNGGGAGGAGGYRNSYSTETSGGGGSSETSLELSAGTVYTITVGAGGASNDSFPNTYGDDGNDSSISGTGITTITSIGGGGAGGAGRRNGASGGSGGGGSEIGTGASGTANQGFAGGNGNGSSPETGGGGGGAGGAGSTATTSFGGNGGSSLSSSITGSSVDRAGGGGGGGRDATPAGTGGGGGASNGSFSTSNASDATANTGSGAGGSHDGNAGDGGSGVVILRMADADYSGTTTGSPTVTTGVGGTDTVLVFNASGSYTG